MPRAWRNLASLFLPYVHTLGNIRKISQISLERKWSSWKFQKLVTDTLNLEMVVTEEKTSADSKTMNWITHATGLVNSCEGKFAGVLFLQLAVILMVIQVLVV